MTARYLRQLLLLVALVQTPCVACAQADASRGDQGSIASAVRAGRYEDALAALEMRLTSQPRDMAAARAQLRTLLLLGRIPEGLTLGARYAAEPNGAAILTTLGRLQRAAGRDQEARSSFARAIAERAPDSLRARLEAAILHFDEGQTAQAMTAFDSFIDVFNARAASLGADELLAVGIACRYLGRNDPPMFRDALRALDQAVKRDSSDDAASLEAAALFLEKYSFADAKQTLDPILARNAKHPRALALMARLRRAEGHPGEALTFVTRALEVAPAHPELRALEASLLLDLERLSDARSAAERALGGDSTSAGARAALAAVRFLAGDSTGIAAQREGLAPRSRDEVDYFTALAEIAGRNRLYREAAGFVRRALAADSLDAHALALLGNNLLRIGEMKEGRARLEQAFARDPYDLWTKNTLDLLDTAPQYEEVAGEHVILVIERKDAPLVALYALPLAERAYAELAARYRYQPSGRLRLEFFRSHADFSVRTVGLAGLDALGVSFGPVVALLAPAARPPGEYNWGSTLWHELTHSFTLGVSAHRVPRWLSEGLSVHEEHRAAPAWGSDATPAFLQAFLGDRLAPVSQLNDGFMRPKYPEQIMFSYYQASLVCEMIEKEHGIDGIRRMLAAYAAGKSSDQVFREVLRIEPKALDTRFTEYVRERFKRELVAVTPSVSGSGSQLQRSLERVRELRQGGDTREAIAELNRAKELFPNYSGPGAPAGQLAQLYEQSGDRAAAVRELRALTAIDEDAYSENIKLAELARALGDTATAIEALDRAMYMHPYTASAHSDLATLGEARRDFERAIRERRAVLALDPADPLEAQYSLAAALFAAGRRADARRELLRLLDRAPHFEKAQELLLRIRETPPSP
ncbi:MAG: tetratricopeptide repeat protein [Gemmatimonadaceae bacterium]